MNEQEQFIESLVAIRSEGLTLAKKIQALPGIQHDMLSRFIACLAKLEAFDALLTMEIDSRRDDTQVQQQQGGQQ